jgi:hexokinase
MTAMPDGFLEQIKQLEEIFTVDAARLKQIVDHFVKELEKGEVDLSFGV